MTQARQHFLDQLAQYLASVSIGHTLRVAIDGVDTSGKTTLADELVQPLEHLGKPVIRASIDKFHFPRERRYARGKDSPEGYYYDSFDNANVVEQLLEPLGQPGQAVYRDVAFDYKTDKPLTSEPKTAPQGAILLFDGVFLLRPELNPHWDLRIFVDVPFAEVLKRAEIRDREFMGDEVEAKYRMRYIPGQELYLNSVQPQTLADILVDNSDFNNPVIKKQRL